MLHRRALSNWSRAQDVRSMEASHQGVFSTFIGEEGNIPEEGSALFERDVAVSHSSRSPLPTSLSNYEAIDDEEDSFDLDQENQRDGAGSSVLERECEDSKQPWPAGNDIQNSAQEWMNSEHSSMTVQSSIPELRVERETTKNGLVVLYPTFSGRG